MKITDLYSWLFKKTGGHFILIVVAIAQFATFIFTIPVSFLIRLNAEFTNEEFLRLWGITIPCMLASLLLLLVHIYLTNQQTFRRLQAVKKGAPLPESAGQEREAWIQVSSLPWNYARRGTLFTLLIGFAPMLVYETLVMRLPADQVIYTFIGVSISALSALTLGMIALEGMLMPARLALLPKGFDAQIAGTSSLNILTKLNLVILTLIVIGVLLVAPIGYHFTALALESPDQPDLLTQYQLQSLGFSVLAILLGFGLAWMLSRSVSTPLKLLVDTVQQVEKGQLSQSAPVVSADEIGALTVYFNRMLEQIGLLQGQLELQVAERTAQLSAVNEVGRAVSAILDPDELIERVVNLITDRFGHYYAALFLLDPSERWAELKSATGDAGRVLKESRHRLEVGGKSMVGSAITQKTARIALDVGAEPVRFDNPLLPYTHSEIALPLAVGDHVLGALDVQSTKPSAFGPQDVETLQNMANQVAVAIENARLFQETRMRLQEVQVAQRQYLQNAWSSLATQQNLEYGVGDAGAGEAEVNIPLALRDQIIGQITLAGDSEWSQEDRSWVESVATQAAVALENARLMDESRAQAAVERAVTEITKRIWSASTVEGILRTAVKELGVALNASEAIIELDIKQDERGQGIA